MPLPKVAIIGRPNVGKSSLLNTLARRRIAIVDPTAGVTRDRVSAIIEADDRWFELVDTGGMDFRTSAEFAADVSNQIEFAIREASVIVFVVDVQDGRQPLDDQIAGRLRSVGVPVMVAANKADSDQLAQGAADFHAFGYEPVLAVSAKHGRGRRELLAAIRERLPADAAARPEAVAMKLAIVGKRNAGKSTLINALAGSERVIVSEVPGTTRDAVDIRFEKDGLTYVAIDTAGVRKRKSVQDDIEFYSLTRAMESIRRADVVLLLIDATTPVSQVDKHLGATVEKDMKPVILVVNKWDLAKGHATTGDFADYLARQMPGLAHAPLAFTTAKDARNVSATIDLARNLFKQAQSRVTTAELNRVIDRAIRAKHPPSPQATLPKIYFATQVAVCPPTVVLFVNNPDLFEEPYRRFIENRLRDELPFPEVPIRLVLRAHAEPRGSAGKKHAASPKPKGRPRARRGKKR
ncbi:MAG TPA: ribosome biogenesis GTPase Der [Phycisphaerae bacterium]|nr:ribosome biogenesis GTPase Der [Phycisphaerae bacterium]